MARRKPLGRLGLLVLSWNILYENVEARETRLLPGFDDDNQRIFVPSHRTPALYTGDFGDCGGGGDDLFSITKFDAGLYRDNSTVLFHLHGSSTLVEENVMCTSVDLGLGGVVLFANESQYIYRSKRVSIGSENKNGS